MPSKPGFYSVRVGRVPGIYKTWDECLEQVKGFSSALFKKFERFEQALEFVNRPSSPRPSKPRAIFDSQPPSLHCLSSLLNDTTRITDYPAKVQSDLHTQIAPTNVIGPAEVMGQDHDEQQEITRKRRREPTDDHNEPELPALEDGDKSVEILRNKKTTTERPTRRSRRQKAKHLTLMRSANTDTALRDFFSLAKYTNPEALARLEAVGFGSHELLTMKGLREGAIARRFRQLIGSTSNSAAQVESLAFAVANATADVWNGLERHI